MFRELAAFSFVVLGASCFDLPIKPKDLPKIPVDFTELSRDLPIQPKIVKQVDALPCGETANLAAGQETTIESPKYPKRYPNKANCTWELNIPAEETLNIFCEFFHVKKRDYLEIVDIFQPFNGFAPEGFSALLDPYPTDYTLQIRFTSNRRGRGKGFRCQLSTEPYYTSTTTTTESSETTTSGNSVVSTTATSSNSTGSSCQCGIPNRSNRIVGGVETEVNEYPWQVGLVSSSGTRPWCGGTLISDRHVMTAAHCTAGSSASSIKVLLGEHYTNDGQYNRVALSAITDHPGYNSNNMDNDFSILTLAEPVTFTSAIRPACLPFDTSKTYAGEKVTVTGWGTLTSGGNQPTSLQEVEVTVTTNAVCNQAYGIISDNMICAADSGKDSCQGDSGGPLVAFEEGRYALVGVVSFGYGCAFDGYPGVYARVTAQKDWILANTQGTQDSNCAA